MKNKYIAIISLLFFFISCKKEGNRFETIQKGNWLLNQWENKTPDGVFSEKWIQKDDSTFYGESFFIAKQDTLFAETMEIIQRDTSLVLIISVPNQNEEKPVTFNLTSIAEKEFIFENPKHDFPKKIRYTLVNPDSIYAEISGDGKKQSFPFKKVK